MPDTSATDPAAELPREIRESLYLAIGATCGTYRADEILAEVVPVVDRYTADLRARVAELEKRPTPDEVRTIVAAELRRHQTTWRDLSQETPARSPIGRAYQEVASHLGDRAAGLDRGDFLAGVEREAGETQWTPVD